jgi:hypothetical protein
MGIVALSLTIISLCALARTVCEHHHHEGRHHGRWGHGGRECGEWGHGGGCGMREKMAMMRCWRGEHNDDDGSRCKDNDRHGGEERHADKK